MTGPPSTATIRDARAEDVPRLLELYLQLSGLSQHPEETVRPVSEAHHSTFREIDEDPNTRLLVGEEDGRVVGTFTLYVMPTLSHGGRPFAIVENVVVDSEVRGTGLGKRLMAEAVRLAREAGCYKVALTSNNKRSAAHLFYAGIGFDPSHQGFTLYFEE